MVIINDNQCVPVIVRNLCPIATIVEQFRLRDLNKYRFFALSVSIFAAVDLQSCAKALMIGQIFILQTQTVHNDGIVC